MISRTKGWDLSPLWQRLKNDLSPAFFAVCLSICLVSLDSFFEHTSHKGAAFFSLVGALYLSISWWLIDDARRTHYHLSMAHGFLVICLFPFFTIVYLFQSRGWMALVTLPLYTVILILSYILLGLASSFLIPS